MARKILSESEIVSDILKAPNCNITPDYIEHLNNLRIALTTTQRICPEKYHRYAQEFKQKYYDLGLNYYHLCSTVHKGIEHAADAMRAIYKKSHVLSIGSTAETALETNNKNVKENRKYHLRSTSREDAMHDLLVRAIYRSDPHSLAIYLENKVPHKKEELPQSHSS